MGIIAKAHFYLSSQTLMNLYYSLVYPFLTYCNVAWSFTYCSNLNCIYLLQKRLVRLITKAHYLANTAPLFSQLKVLDIFSINSFSVATFMYSYHHNLLPSSFRDLFLSSNQVHQSSASSKVYLTVYRKIDKTSKLPKMTFLGQETVRRQHLNGSLCAFSPYYRSYDTFPHKSRRFSFTGHRFLPHHKYSE